MGQLIGLAIIAVIIVSLWKVFTKAGQPGWACLIPFYNLFILVKIAGREWWWFLLCFIPVVGIVIARILDRSRLQSVSKQAEELARQAREEAEKIRREAELKVKDDLYQKREELNREMEQIRAEVRDQERRVSKREDGLEEKLDAECRGS